MNAFDGEGKVHLAVQGSDGDERLAPELIQEAMRRGGLGDHAEAANGIGDA